MNIVITTTMLSITLGIVFISSLILILLYIKRITKLEKEVQQYNNYGIPYQRDLIRTENELDIVKDRMHRYEQMCNSIDGVKDSRQILSRIFWNHVNGNKDINSVIKEWKKAKVVNKPGGTRGRASS